jgi:LysR family transcriptional regulator, glycine cleavage system transcriptional activator
VAFDLPPLIWLRAFEASSRSLSFTDAAAELNLSQAAVSKHVKSLEQHLRHQLFVRGPRSLTLTKSGEAYLPKVRDAFERLAVGTREVFGGRRSQELTVRCSMSFGVVWLAPRLPDFLARYPKTDVRIISSVWNEASGGDICDLDIQYGTGNWQGVQSHRLSWETITPLCAPALADRLNHPDDLQRERLLHVLGYQEGWGTWLQAAGAKAVNPGQGLRFDTSVTAFEVAAKSGGVALGRLSLAQREQASGRLVAPFDLELPIKEAFYILQPTDSDLHPDAEPFLDWILGAASDERNGAVSSTIR